MAVDLSDEELISDSDQDKFKIKYYNFRAVNLTYNIYLLMI